jgi:hypothetical protein
MQPSEANRNAAFMRQAGAQEEMGRASAGKQVLDSPRFVKHNVSHENGFRQGPKTEFSSDSGMD